ncbi:PEP-CTERM sorting domain-containing protein [bacterium]|nr:MAG: PEP-CTERM sorting domain-containing protein [bacterium]
MRFFFAIALAACAATSIAQAHFRGIGISNGFTSSQLVGLSLDGKIAVGNRFKDDAEYPVIEAFFSDAMDQRGTGWLAGSVLQSRAVGISSNGKSMFATVYEGTPGSGGHFVVGLANDGGAIQSLGMIEGADGLYGRAFACAAQTLFVTASHDGGNSPATSYRWTPSTGYVEVTTPTSNHLEVSGTSRDATGIVGAVDGVAIRYNGFNWATIDADEDETVALTATTNNAHFMAGTKYAPDMSSSVAMRWTDDTPTILGDLQGGGDFGSALAMTEDGAFVVGTGTVSEWVYDEQLNDYIDIGRASAWVWSESMGMKSVTTLLEDNGLFLDWDLQTATSVVMNNGVLTIGGNGVDGFGRSQGWVASVGVQAVPEPGTWAALGLGALALIRRRRTLP